MDFKNYIRYVKDFPVKGILFRDLSPFWADSNTLKESTLALSQMVKELKPTKLVAMESRGFVVGSSLAFHLGVGMVMLRKEGKLPQPSFKIAYATEYTSKGFIEIEKDALKEGERVLFVDDILATGKSATQAAQLLLNFKGINFLGFLFLLEIQELKGRNILEALNYPVISLIKD
jgi:adenine phosphoribosyltransferase